VGRWLAGWITRVLLRLAYFAHGADGLNALFLIMPARFLTPTLRRHGATIGNGVEMQTPITFHNVSPTFGQHYKNLNVGADSYLGKEVFLDLADEIRIENNVTVSMRVMLLTHTHAGKSPLIEGRLKPSYAPIVLGTGCYIGAGAIILPGVEIGRGAIVGAGAIVTCMVESGTTVVGMPARVIQSAAE